MSSDEKTLNDYLAEFDQRHGPGFKEYFMEKFRVKSTVYENYRRSEAQHEMSKADSDWNKYYHQRRNAEKALDRAFEKAYFSS